METVIVLYIIFCVTTSITGMFILLQPTLAELTDMQPDNLIVQTKFIGYAVFFFMGVLTAPVLFLPTIHPEYGNSFRKSLLNSIRD